jgi:hypothetical protein
MHAAGCKIWRESWQEESRAVIGGNFAMVFELGLDAGQAKLFFFLIPKLHLGMFIRSAILRPALKLAAR